MNDNQKHIQKDTESKDLQALFKILTKSVGHKYLRKYEKNGQTIYVYEDSGGKTKHRLSEEDSRESLQNMGMFLFDVDAVEEQNGKGFNKIDYARWDKEGVDGKTNILKNILKKYKRQLIDQFGLDSYEHAGLSDPTIHKVIPLRNKYGIIELPMKSDGRLQRNKFGQYIQIQKHYGAKGSKNRWGDFVWYVPLEHEAKFDWENYSKDMKKIGIELDRVPPPLKKKDKSGDVATPLDNLSVDEAIEVISSGKVKDIMAMKFDEKTGMISIHSTFDRDAVNLFSNKGGQITGITEYNPNNKARETYDINLAEEILSKFKDKFPNWRVVTGGLKAAIQKEKKRVLELKKPLPNVEKVLDSKYSLFPYQNEAVRFLENADGNALIGDEMGLGKTLQSLAYVAGNDKKVLVVTPKVVRRTWIQEAEKFFPDYFKGKSKELIPAELRKHGMPDLDGFQIVTVNYESLEKFMPAIEKAGFDTIIVDESHRIKSPKAKITQTISSMASKFKHKILLSGTAVKNKKEELFTQLEIIKPGTISKRALQFGTIGGVWNTLQKKGVYLARQKKKVLPDLPEKITQITEMPIKNMPRMPDNIGAMSKAKVSAAMAKTEATKDFVKEILASSESNVLVFTESVEAAKKLKEDLGDKALLHYGQMSDEAREAAKLEFQREDSPKRIFISTRQSLAVGATLTRADKVVFNDLPWTASDLRQAEDRAHRIGQKNTVNVYWITAQDNQWDSNLSDIIKKKYELNKKVNEGSQLTSEEIAWMNTPVSLSDIRSQMVKKGNIALDSLKEILQKGKRSGVGEVSTHADGSKDIRKQVSSIMSKILSENKIKKALGLNSLYETLEKGRGPDLKPRKRKGEMSDEDHQKNITNHQKKVVNIQTKLDSTKTELSEHDENHQSKMKNFNESASAIMSAAKQKTAESKKRVEESKARLKALKDKLIKGGQGSGKKGHKTTPQGCLGVTKSGKMITNEHQRIMFGCFSKQDHHEAYCIYSKEINRINHLISDLRVHNPEFKVPEVITMHIQSLYLDSKIHQSFFQNPSSINHVRRILTGDSINKSIVNMDGNGHDLDTSSYSKDAEGSQDSKWIKVILHNLEDYTPGSPMVDVDLERGIVLSISRIDDGMYSGMVKDSDGDVLYNFAAETLPSLIQHLKAKETIDIIEESGSEMAVVGGIEASEIPEIGKMYDILDAKSKLINILDKIMRM